MSIEIIPTTETDTSSIGPQWPPVERYVKKISRLA